MACHKDLESVEKTPILFLVPPEDSDEEEEDDTEYVDSAGFRFGASLATRKLPADGSLRRFSHKFVDKEPDHKVLDQLKEDDELYCVNGLDVTSWNHELLIKTLQDLSGEIKLVFYRESIHFTGEEEVIKKEYIEITFILGALDCDSKGGIDDLVSLIKDVVVKFVTSTEIISVRDTEFLQSKECRFRHDPTGLFLMIKKDKPVFDVLGDSNCASRFNVLTYSIMETLTDRETGKERDFPNSMVAIQCDLTKKFLVCSYGYRKLFLVKDEDIDKDMKNVKPNSPYLFLLWSSGNGRSFYFESLAYPAYFLAFDKVRLLRMEEMKHPPYSDRFKETDNVRRNFAFEMM